MNPGETKVHRECAVRCISGGVPPLLVARDETGAHVHLWLVSPSGGALGGEILDRVAERVRVTGRLLRADGRLLLYADPRGIRR
jgi:hypothetical protein